MLRSYPGRLALCFERGGHRLKPIPKTGIVFKSSLVLSGKAAKDNFTTEPRSPSRLLNRIEPICNKGEGFDKVVSQARGQNNRPFLRWYSNAN